MNTKLLVLALSVLTLLSACRKGEEVTEPDMGYEYFPTDVGTWVEYQVDSLWRDDAANVRDSVSYRLLVRIMAHYADLEGRPCQRIHRFVADGDGQWVVRDVWTSTMDTRAAEMTEENYRRLKLSFPVRRSRRWDVNAFGTGATGNPDGNDELMVGYSEVDAAWSNGHFAFPRTALVKNTVPANFVNRRDFEERYAHGVGMVYKLWEETNTQLAYPPQGPPQTQVRGWRLRMTAVAHGID